MTLPPANDDLESRVLVLLEPIPTTRTAFVRGLLRGLLVGLILGAVGMWLFH